MSKSGTPTVTVGIAVVCLLLAAGPVPQVEERLGLGLAPAPEGARVTEANQGGAAFQAGLRRGDLIIAIDGVPLAGATVEQVRTRLATERPDMMQLRLRRGGATQEIRLRRPSSARPAPRPGPSLADGAPGPADPREPVSGPQSGGRPEVIARAQVAVGDPMLDFTLPRIGGGEITLSRLKGRPIFIDFWATWCAPCRSEAPALATLYRRYGDRIQMLGLSLDFDPRAPLSYAAEFGLGYPHLLTTGWLDPAVQAYGVHQTGIPFNVLIDAGGRVAALDLHGEPLARAMDSLARSVAPAP